MLRRPATGPTFNKEKDNMLKSSMLKGTKLKGKRLTTLICILALVVMTALTGCGGGASEEASSGGDAAAGGKTLIYGSGDYTSINPALFEHGEINALLFAGLTAHDKDNKVVPGLAEDWDFDKDSLTYTFTLRDGLTFHDGEPLTSEDVKFTLESILDEKNQSEIVSNYTDIKSVECPDEKTVKITLSRMNVAFPEYMTIGILPKHLLEGKDMTTDEFNQNPVGAGPYKLAEWDMGQSITMEKFDGYYGGTPKIDTVIFKIVPDTDARAMQLASGDLDMAQITAKTADDVEKTGNYTVYNMKTADYRAIAYNFAGSDLFKKHPELANCLSYGIDRKAIIDSVLLGEGQEAYSPIQKNEFNKEDIEHFDYDPAKMESELEKAGWKKNADGIYEKDGDALKFNLDAMADDQVRVDMAKMCAEQLSQHGVAVTARAQKEIDWAGFDAVIIGWGSPFDADDHMYKIFTTGAGDNYTGYSNKKVDEALSAARATDDADKRAALYGDALTAMTKAMPYSFIAYIDADYAIKNGVTGITQETLLGHHGVGVFWNIAEWDITEK